MKTIMTALAAVAVLLLAACGTSQAQLHETPPPSTPAAKATSAPPGPQRFIAEVRAAGFGGKDLTTASDQTLLTIGSDECSALSAANGNGIAGYSRMIDSLVKNGAHATVHQAAVLLDSAIRNLCPENSNMMPSGAP